MKQIEPFDEPIYVTRPFMPPLSEYARGLEEIWKNKWLTNDGPVLQQLEKRLGDYFKTRNLSLFTNGTLALQIALQGLGITGEVITTPFTFVATTHALYWNKIRPIFADIEPTHFTLDPEKVEALITPWTTAILAVHVFGHPCRLKALEEIAKKNNLALIYDAAHAFGVKVNGRSIAHYGDLSMFSFHATKLYHTMEGGLIAFKDSRLARTLYYLKNFGFKNQTEVVMPGTNAKMNELQGLMGIQALEYIDELIRKHKEINAAYRRNLGDVSGIEFCPEVPADVDPNFAYVPVLIEKTNFGMSRDALFEELKKYNVFARRYFYPLVNDFACYQHLSVSDPLIVAKNVSNRILTLPTYYDLELDDVNRICDIILLIQGTKR
ncbi:Aminotransferase, DegT/DnrJ/EryC1/StrS family [Olavius algarvensis Delta 1 endosymbiont]|nr:Aminotransferase, DegT/DnrJ/EryC1/StrS family [Olavius algarvensis Delta 1 endosymbiont]